MRLHSLTATKWVAVVGLFFMPLSVFSKLSNIYYWGGYGVVSICKGFPAPGSHGVEYDWRVPTMEQLSFGAIALLVGATLVAVATTAEVISK